MERLFFAVGIGFLVAAAVSSLAQGVYLGAIGCLGFAAVLAAIARVTRMAPPEFLPPGSERDDQFPRV